MSHEIRANYNQLLLIPPCLDDFVTARDPVRFIREFVDSLDLKEMGFKMPQTDEGRPCYAADLLLKVWIYGFLERIRSTRKLEKACHQHVGLMWLTGMHHPDHNSLWRFWRDNKKVLKSVFRKTVELAIKMELVDMVLNAVDGTKIASASSTRALWDKAKLEETLACLEKLLDKAMAEVEVGEKSESGEYALPEQLRDTAALRDRVREKLQELEKEHRAQMHPKEREAEVMKTQEGKRLGYNGQAVVDAKAGIIVAAEVTREQNDKRQLVPMIEAAREVTGKAADENVADAGYFSGEQLAKAEAENLPVTVSLKELKKAEANGGEFHASKFTYDCERDCCVCPLGGLLNYERTKEASGKDYEVRLYRCQSFQDCSRRWECSRDKQGRTVQVSPYQGEILRQKEKQSNQDTNGLLKKRMAVVEPVFAWIKHLLGFRRWTMCGLEKVKAQWALVCAVVNLSKIYRIWAAGIVG
jgi:transposase